MSRHKTVLFCILFLMVFTQVFAVAGTWSIRGGISQSQTDINDEVKLKGMLGISYELWLARWLSFGVHPYLTEVQAGKENEANFKSTLAGGDLLLRLRPNWKSVAPYLLAGGGVVNFFPKDLAGNRIPGDYDYTVQVMPTVGAGFSFFSRQGVDFDLGVRLHMLKSDFLDGRKIDDDDDLFGVAYFGFAFTTGTKTVASSYSPRLTPFLFVDNPEVKLGSQSGKLVSEIRTNTSWTVMESVPWLEVFPLSGTNNDKITITYNANESTEPRSGQIFISGGGMKGVVTVNQEPGKIIPFVTVAPATHYIASQEGVVFFDVSSNTDWTVQEDVDWFTVTPKSGSGNGRLSVEYKENKARKSRIGQLTLVIENSLRTVNLVQERTRPAPPPERKPQILQGVLFLSGSDQLTKESLEILDEVVATLTYYPEVEVEIQGHTDSTGSAKRNDELSLQRAQSVRKYLVEQGIPETRISVKGFGSRQPIATNNTPEGRAQNRRIEFVKTN